MKKLTLDENMPNVDRVFKRLHDTKIDGVHTELTMVEADAVEDSAKSDEEFEDAMKEIKHEDATLSEKDDEKAVGRNRWYDQKHPHRLVNNIYTNPTNESKNYPHRHKMVEKKSVTEDIDIDSLDDSGNKDWQIDYDMYQFITDVLEPDFVKPQHPRNLEIGKGYYKFGTISKPEKIDDTPVVPAPNPYRGDILVMSNDEKELEHVANVLNKYYKIKSSDIMRAEDVIPNRHKNFSKCIVVTVPKWSPDYPHMFVDYMEDIGLDIDDVMETTSKAGKSDAFRRAIDRQVRKDKFDTKKSKTDVKDENLCVRKHK